MKALMKKTIARCNTMINWTGYYCFSPYFHASTIYRKKRDKAPIKEKTILFEVYAGQKMAETPYVMFQFMLESEIYKEYHFYWVINDEQAQRNLTKYKKYANVTFCRRHSAEYVKILYSAKYLVNNRTFPDYFQKREEQVYINTWNGMSYHKLGKKSGAAIGAGKNITRNLLQTDYLIMPNRFVAEQVLDSYDVAGNFPGTITVTGYPARDYLINTEKKQATAYLEEVGLIKEKERSKVIVLYMPIWMNGAVDAENIQPYFERAEDLAQKLGDSYQLILKIEEMPEVWREFPKEKYTFAYATEYTDSNRLLAAADGLITDYSGIFIEYAMMGGTTVFYRYDNGEYEIDRAVLFAEEDLSGPIFVTADATVKAIQNRESFHYDQQIQNLKKKFCEQEDGQATQRVCDIVFLQKASKEMFRSQNEKKKILAVCDLKSPTGKMEQLVEFAKQLDSEKYDLSVLWTGRPTKRVLPALRVLQEDARLYYSVGKWNLNKSEYYYKKMETKFLPEKRLRLMEQHRSMYQNQLERLLGHGHYDIGISFSEAISDTNAILMMSDIPQKILVLSKRKDSENILSAAKIDQYYNAVITTDSDYADGLKQVLAKEKVEVVKSFVNFSVRTSQMTEKIQTELLVRATYHDKLMMHYDADGGDKTAGRQERAKIKGMIAEYKESMDALSLKLQEEKGFQKDAYNQDIMTVFYRVFE